MSEKHKSGAEIAGKVEGLMGSTKALLIRVQLMRDEAASNAAQPVPIGWEGNGRAEVLRNLSIAITHLEDVENRLARVMARVT